MLRKSQHYVKKIETQAKKWLSCVKKRVYTKQVSFQKSETHILLSYWKQPSRGILQNAFSKQLSKTLRKIP